MNFINAIKSLTLIDYNKYECYDDYEIELMQISDCIEDRISFLEDREPESDGEVYDNWCDKLSALEDIQDLFETYVDDCEKCEVWYDGHDSIKKEKLKRDIEYIYNEVLSYQSSYGGLMRLRV